MAIINEFQVFVDHLLDRGVTQCVSSYDGHRIELALGIGPNQLNLLNPKLAELAILGNRPDPVPQLTMTQDKPAKTKSEQESAKIARLAAIRNKTRAMVKAMHDAQNVDAVERVSAKQLKEALIADGVDCSNIHRDINAMISDGDYFDLEFFILYHASDNPAFVLNYTQEDFKKRLTAHLNLGRKRDSATASLLMNEYANLDLPGGRRQYQNPNA